MRWLELAGRLTGVSPELEEREREQIATRLGVATMTVLAGAGSWERSWQSRGAAIVAVLVALAVSARLGDRMGAADTAPRQRWEQGRELRFPTDDADLYRHFVTPSRSRCRTPRESTGGESLTDGSRAGCSFRRCGPDHHTNRRSRLSPLTGGPAPWNEAVTVRADSPVAATTARLAKLPASVMLARRPVARTT